MEKNLPRQRKPTLEDIKRMATPATAPGAGAVVRAMPPEGGAAGTGVARPEPPASSAPAEQSPSADWRQKAARDIVSRYRTWSIAAAASPVPFIDMAVVSGLQLRMVYRLAQLYGVPFERVRARSLISSLLGSWIPFSVTAAFAGAAAKMAPGLGTIVGIGSAMGTSVLATETIGKVFIRHFESGGTLLDFEPEKFRGDFVKPAA